MSVVRAYAAKVSRPARFLAAILVAVVGVVGCSGAEPGGATGAGSAGTAFSGRVDITESGLRLDGTDWWPAGYNAYQLGTDWSINVGCGAQVDLDEYFGSLPPRALTRFNLCSALAVDKTTGILSFGPLDAVFAAADRHDQMVLPLLSGGSGDCENERFKQRDWYIDGWRTDLAPGGVTYEQWLRTAVERWRDEPMIAGWELVGEPEASICGPAGCRWHERLCPPGGVEVLRGFFDAAGRYLRELDDSRPIFSGFTGGDQCGLVGPDLERVAGSSYVDVLDFHDYPDDGQQHPPGSDLPSRLEQARNLHKPLVVNEIGLEAGSCRSDRERAHLLGAAIDAAREAGVAGMLVWAFVPDPRIDQCTYDVGYGDPIAAVVAGSIR